MSRRRTDWALQAAHRIFELTPGLSQAVAVSYIAAELRMAYERGTAQASKPKPPAKDTLV